MKRCAVCDKVCGDVPSCDGCGESSWSIITKSVEKPAAKPVAAPAEAPAKKGVKKKSAKTAAPAMPQISDEDFAAELALASDSELLSLMGNENLSDSQSDLLAMEIAKRDDGK